MLVCFSLNSYAQQQQRVFTSVTGHLMRVTPKLADIDRNTMYGQPLQITRDMNGIIGYGEKIDRVEERIEEQLNRRAAGTNAGAVQNPSTIFPHTPTSIVGANWNGGTSPGLQPTDNNMAVGPNHVIQVVNDVSGSRFYIWNKAGTVIQAGTVLASLTGFSGSGDPIVLYDQLADRWLLAEFGVGAGGSINNLNIAISTTNNPTGSWFIYQYNDNSFFMDYPKFSVWHNAYFAYTNDFNNAGTAYLGSSVYAFDRTNMLAGVPTVTMIRTRMTDPSNMFYNMGAVSLDGSTPATSSGLYLVPNPPSTLNIFSFTPDFAVPGNSVISPLTPLTVAAFSAPPASVPMQGGGTIQTLGYRMIFKVSLRNIGGVESIVAGHTVANGGLAAVRWYQLRKVASAWTVFQQGTITGSDGNSRFMPTLSMDGCGNIAMSYDLSGTSSFPSVKYTGRNAADPLNTMTLAESTIINATTNFGGFRWGDYNTTVPDYPNNGSFWTTSQYGNQQTRVANFTLTGGCAPAPSIQAGSYTLVSESCAPANGVIDPGETVTVSFCLNNSGDLATTNAVGNLLATGGIIAGSSQNYGVINALGGTVCRNFTFTNNSTTCGSTITASMQVQDGATNLGTVSWTIPMGQLITNPIENFDAVVAPALPAGWSAVNTVGPAPLWVTSNAGALPPPAVSAPNSIFVDDPGVASGKDITSAVFNAVPGASISFQSSYDFEPGWDGGVLEISINGGAFQDIVTAGGVFTSNGYNTTLITGTANPLTGRLAWSGANGGFQVTTVKLPLAAGSLPIRLKWRAGSDASVAHVGWRIDDIIMTYPSCCGAPCVLTCPANITTGAAAGQCGANVNFSASASGLCGPITYTPASGSFFPVGTTTVNVTSASGATCSFTVTVVDNVPPTISCPANITRNNDPNLCSAVVTYSLPGVSDNCPLPGAISFNQTTNSNTITAGVSVACTAAPNQWWRAYQLAQPNPVTITSVRFGIEQATAQTATVRVFTVTGGTFPAGTLTQIASQTVAITATPNVFYNVSLASAPIVAANAQVVVQVDMPVAATWLGANSLGQSAPGYLSASACGITTPTNIATLGFPTDHVILGFTATDPAGSLTQIAGLPSGSIFPVGTTVNTFRAIDAAGNTSTCSFNVTVVDAQAPSITCPANITRNTDAGVCYATVAVPNPTTSDNCGVTAVTWAMTGATVASSPATGINYVGTRQFNLNGTTGQGITTVTYTVKDAAGNTTTCSFTVTVNDAVLPVISVQPATKFFCVGSAGTFSVTASANGGPLAYQWQEWNGTAWANIAGATTNSYTVPNVSFADNTRSFRVVLTGLCSSVTSQFASLYVNPLPTVSLIISVPPSLLPGQSVTITANASPAGGTYAWYKNGVLTSHTGSTWTGLTVDDIGTYKVTYTDANGCSSTTSDLAITGQASDNLYVYPVPNNGVFTVRFFNTPNETATVSVFDSKGAKVYEKANITTLAYTGITVDLGPTMASGTYVVVVNNSAGKKIGAKRIVVRHKP